MSKADDNDNLSGGGYLAWLFISVVTILMVTLIIPFPISLAVSLIIIIALYVIRADMGLKKTGMGDIRGWYKSVSSSGSRRGWGTDVSSSVYKALRFSCMKCGNEHRKTACPKCGSRAVKVS